MRTKSLILMFSIDYVFYIFEHCIALNSNPFDPPALGFNGTWRKNSAEMTTMSNKSVLWTLKVSFSHCIFAMYKITFKLEETSK